MEMHKSYDPDVNLETTKLNTHYFQNMSQLNASSCAFTPTALPGMLKEKAHKREKHYTDVKMCFKDLPECALNQRELGDKLATSWLETEKELFSQEKELGELSSKKRVSFCDQSSVLYYNDALAAITLNNYVPEIVSSDSKHCSSLSETLNNLSEIGDPDLNLNHCSAYHESLLEPVIVVESLPKLLQGHANRNVINADVCCEISTIEQTVDEDFESNLNLSHNEEVAESVSNHKNSSSEEIRYTLPDLQVVLTRLPDDLLAMHASYISSKAHKFNKSEICPITCMENSIHEASTPKKTICHNEKRSCQRTDDSIESVFKQTHNGRNFNISLGMNPCVVLERLDLLFPEVENASDSLNPILCDENVQANKKCFSDSLDVIPPKSNVYEEVHPEKLGFSAFEVEENSSSVKEAYPVKDATKDPCPMKSTHSLPEKFSHFNRDPPSAKNKLKDAFCQCEKNVLSQNSNIQIKPVYVCLERLHLPVHETSIKLVNLPEDEQQTKSFYVDSLPLNRNSASESHAYLIKTPVHRKKIPGKSCSRKKNQNSKAVAYLKKKYLLSKVSTHNEPPVNPYLHKTPQNNSSVPKKSQNNKIYHGSLPHLTNLKRPSTVTRSKRKIQNKLVQPKRSKNKTDLSLKVDKLPVSLEKNNHLEPKVLLTSLNKDSKDSPEENRKFNFEDFLSEDDLPLSCFTGDSYVCPATSKLKTKKKSKHPHKRNLYAVASKLSNDSSLCIGSTYQNPSISLDNLNTILHNDQTCLQTFVENPRINLPSAPLLKRIELDHSYHLPYICNGVSSNVNNLSCRGDLQIINHETKTLTKRNAKNVNLLQKKNQTINRNNSSLIELPILHNQLSRFDKEFVKAVIPKKKKEKMSNSTVLVNNSLNGKTLLVARNNVKNGNLLQKKSKSDNNLAVLVENFFQNKQLSRFDRGLRDKARNKGVRSHKKNTAVKKKKTVSKKAMRRKQAKVYDMLIKYLNKLLKSKNVKSSHKKTIRGHKHSVRKQSGENYTLSTEVKYENESDQSVAIIDDLNSQKKHVDNEHYFAGEGPVSCQSEVACQSKISSREKVRSKHRMQENLVQKYRLGFLSANRSLRFYNKCLASKRFLSSRCKLKKRERKELQKLFKMLKKL